MNSTAPHHQSLGIRDIAQAQDETAGYIRLLSWITDEPIETIMERLQKKMPVVAPIVVDDSRAQ